MREQPISTPAERARYRLYYRKNAEKKKAESKAWREAHPDKVQEYRRKHTPALIQAHRSNNPSLVRTLLLAPTSAGGRGTEDNVPNLGRRIPRRRGSDDQMSSWGMLEPLPEKPLKFE